MGLAVALAGCGGTSGTGGGGGGSTNPSFTVSASPSPLSVAPGGSAGLSLAIQGEDGFDGAGTGTLGGLPAGVTASPATFSFTGTESQQIQIAADSSAVAGTYTITVNASSGALSASTQFQLTVTPPPTLSLTVQPSSLTLIPGVQQSLQITVNATGGYNQLVTGTISNLPAGVTSAGGAGFSVFPGGASTLYLTAAAGASPGTALISAGSGSLSASVQLPIAINTAPGFSLTTGGSNTFVVSQNAYTSLSFSAVAYNGFSLPVSVSFSGAPAGVTFSPATFSLQPGGPPQNVTISTTFSTPVSSGVPIAVQASGGGAVAQLQLTLVVLAPTVDVSVQPVTLSVPAGSINSFELGVDNAALGTPSGSIQIQVTGGPSGVALSPASFTAPAQGVNLDIFATASASASGSAPVTVTATYGPVKTTATLNVAVTSADSFSPVSLSTTDQVIERDSITPYTSYPEPNYLLYNAPTNRFFSSDAYLNQLNVVNAATRNLIATLDIPGAFGIDQSPDGSKIYVGTLLGDLYVVDPVAMSVLQRIPSSSISPWGFNANAVYAMADGQLLLEQYLLLPGFSWVDGNGPLALWNPATNSITFFRTPQDMTGLEPEEPICLDSFENVILTNNRTRVLLVPILTSEGSSLVCSFDPDADTWNWSAQITGGLGSALTTFAVSSDGNTLAAYDGYDIYNLDPATLTVKNSFSVPVTQGLLNYPVMLMSADNSHVFITDANGADVLDQYDLSTGQETGWIPEANVPAPDSYSPIGPFYQGITPQGLAAGVVQGGGIGLLDTTAVHPLPVGSRFTLTELNMPYGPVTGGTDVAWFPDSVGVQPPPLGSVYFGTQPAADLDNAGFDGNLEAVTPAGVAGPVDVRTFATDGGSQLLPWGFSYGPSVLEAATQYATADGGGPASLYGFGFGPQLYGGGSYIAPPSDLQVSVGGNVAPVQGFNPRPYGSNYFTFPPLPATSLLYTVPPGSAGSTQPIVVANSSGSASSAVSLTYLPAVQQYSVDGELADGVYDPTRDVYYFTDANQVRVFSVSQGWLPSIPIPAPTGAYGPQRLYGIAISPDGSRLAISDPGAIAIYLLDPDTPSAIQSFPFASLGGLYPQSDLPAGLAVDNSGNVYFATFNPGGDGGDILRLDTSTGQFTTIPAGGTTIGDTNVRVVLSADGSRLYFNIEGVAGYYDTVSGQTIFAPQQDGEVGQGSDEVVLAPNQTQLFVDGFLTDSNLNNVGFQTLDNAEVLDAQYLYGGAFSSDGSLFFQPGVQYIDVFNGQTGDFRARISLPVPLSPNFRALVSDGEDSRLVAITGATGNGVAVINLNSLPEPQPLSYLSFTPGPVRAGTRWRPGTPDPRRGAPPLPAQLPIRMVPHLGSSLFRFLLTPRR